MACASRCARTRSPTSTTTPRASSRTRRATNLTSLVGQSLTYDVRDTAFLPSDGYLLRLDQDVAGLGGDTQFVRHEADRLLLLPVHAGLGAQPGRAAAATSSAIGGEDVHLFDRFFLGGQTLRGFKFAGVGPRDVDDRRRAGRQSAVHRDGGAAFPAGPAGGAPDVRPGVRRGRHADRDRRQRPGDRRQRQPPGGGAASACPGCRRSARSRSTCRRLSSRRTRTRPSSSGSASAPASERGASRAPWPPLDVAFGSLAIGALLAGVLALARPLGGAGRRSCRPRSPR